MLTFIPEKYSIVLAGHFNRHIFSPAWLTGRVTKAEQFEISFPATSPGGPFVLEFDDIAFGVQARRLEFWPKRFEGELFENAAKVARKILDDLHHTPVSGCGINFNFVCRNPSGPLLSLFTLADSNLLSDAKYEIKTTSVSRQLVKGGNQVINIILNLTDNGHVGIAINFHKETASATEAGEFLKAPVDILLSETIELVKSIYDAKVQPEAQEQL